MESIEQANHKLFRKMLEIEHKPFKSLDFSHIDKKKHIIFGKVDAKRREVERIEQENFRLLKRIHDVSPTYNHKVLQKQYDKNEKLTRLHCKYPYALDQSMDATFLSKDRSRSIQSNASNTFIQEFPKIKG